MKSRNRRNLLWREGLEIFLWRRIRKAQMSKLLPQESPISHPFNERLNNKG